MNKQQLNERIAALQTEKTQHEKQVFAIVQHLAAIPAEIVAAQRRYDLQGDDNAKTEVTALRDEQYDLDRKRESIQAELTEFPARLAALREELSLTDHREGLRTLVDRRRSLLESFNEYEQAMLTAITAYHDFAKSYEATKALGKSLKDFANGHRLPVPVGVQSVVHAPGDWYFQLNQAGAAEMTLLKIRQSLAVE